MKADKININALKFGIMCNFTPFCGEERAREAVELIKELERLARIGKATEKAYFNGAFLIYDVVENYDGAIESYNCDETIEELLGWLEFIESEE